VTPPRRWRWGEPIEPLARALADGAILAIPTESSYGLAVDPRDASAVASIFRLKGRRGDSPLPVVAADRGQIEALGARLADPLLERLAALWPAPLSLLLPLGGDLPAAAGHGRLAVRVPAHERLRSLLATLGTALTATSANLSGQPPARRPEEVVELLSGVPGAVLVDDGPLPGGNPSTLAGVRDGQIEVLRRGAVPEGRLVAALERDEATSFSAASVEILADGSR
jgi:L-threonylcarbamoyladenylate synthase